jgi:hypothetical protein
MEKGESVVEWDGVLGGGADGWGSWSVACDERANVMAVNRDYGCTVKVSVI